MIFVEKEIDDDHCIFLGTCISSIMKAFIIPNFTGKGWFRNTRFYQSQIPETRDRLAAIYDDLREDTSKRFHGTAVAAIAHAHPNSGVMHGIYPGENLKNIAFENAGNWLSEDWFSEEPVGSGYHVWNISAQTTLQPNVRGVSRYVEEQLKGYKSILRDIFVVSGGHMSNGEFKTLNTSDCPLFPACLVTMWPLKKSIVVVVGVMKDESGQIVQYREGDGIGDVSAFYRRDFQIAAPAAQFVVPSIDPEFLIQVNGVSFAVPIVSATLARLRTYPLMTSTYAIARLMACAVQSESIRHLTRAGLIDVDCTLSVHLDQVSFGKDIEGHARDEYRRLRKGKVRRIWQNELTRPADEMLVNGDEVRGDYRLRPALQQNYDAVIGIRKLRDRNHTIKVTALRANRDIVDIDVRQPLRSTLIMEFQPEGEDTSVCFELTELRDYIPTIYTQEGFSDALEPNCPGT